MPENKKKIQRWLTPRQCQFIDYLNNSFKFGKLEVVIHNGEPYDSKILEIKKPFDGKIEKGLDSPS